MKLADILSEGVKEENFVEDVIGALRRATNRRDWEMTFRTPHGVGVKGQGLTLSFQHQGGRVKLFVTGKKNANTIVPSAKAAAQYVSKLTEGELPKGSISMGQAKKIGDKIGVDFDKFDLEEFRKGLEVEMEHSETVGDGLEMAGKIALDHLKEKPDYYTRLEKVEESAYKPKKYHLDLLQKLLDIKDKREKEKHIRDLYKKRQLDTAAFQWVMDRALGMTVRG